MKVTEGARKMMNPVIIPYGEYLGASIEEIALFRIRHKSQTLRLYSDLESKYVNLMKSF